MRGIFYRIYLFFVLKKEKNVMNELVKQEKIENLKSQSRSFMMKKLLRSEFALYYMTEQKNRKSWSMNNIVQHMTV